MNATSSKWIFAGAFPSESALICRDYFQWGALIHQCSCETLPQWCRAMLHRSVLFASGLYSSWTQCLRQPVPGSDWQRFWLHWHPRPTHHHQLPAWSAVQVQLQLPVGVPGQQHPAGLVSLIYRLSLTSAVVAVWVCVEASSGEETMTQMGQNKKSDKQMTQKKLAVLHDFLQPLRPFLQGRAVLPGTLKCYCFFL